MSIILAEQNIKEEIEMRAMYCQTLINLAENDERIVMLDADLMNSMGTVPFMKKFRVNEDLKAHELLKGRGITAGVYDMFTLKPIDKEAIIQAATTTGAIVTAENHNIINGLGSALAEVLVENYPVPMERVGVQDLFGEVGPEAYLQKRFGLTGGQCRKSA